MSVSEDNGPFFFGEPGHGWSRGRNRGWGVKKWRENVDILSSALLSLAFEPAYSGFLGTESIVCFVLRGCGIIVSATSHKTDLN